MPESLAALPEGSVLVHIGPYKTGSTALQLALAGQRAELAELGVFYPGPRSRQRRPGWGLIGYTAPGHETATLRDWERLVEKIHASEAARVCISTEDLGAANGEQVARLVDDLGRDRVHVVTVIRSLAQLLPSQWQERVKTRPWPETYGEWLRLVLDPARTDPAAETFWRSHDLPRVIGYWKAQIPAEQFVAIVADRSDRRRVPGTVEQLLALPEGMLEPPNDANASLTRERAEMLRRVNLAFLEHGWTGSDYLHFVREGLLDPLMGLPREPDEGPGQIVPPWAADQLVELSAARAEVLATSGVTVVGDPEALRVSADEFTRDLEEEPTSVPVGVAAAAIAGAIGVGVDAHRKLDELERERDAVRQRNRELRRKVQQLRAAEPEPGIAGYPATDLVREVVRRVAPGMRRRSASG